MDAAEYARQLAEAVARSDALDMRPSHHRHEVRIPVGMAIDGAVVELGYVDGVLIADLRIPAHQPET